MQMQPTPTGADSTGRDFAFGRTAAAALAIANGLNLLLYLVGSIASLPWLAEGACWLLFLEGLFLLLFFVPALTYRVLLKKEHPKLAAARALQSFVTALGLA